MSTLELAPVLFTPALLVVQDGDGAVFITAVRPVPPDAAGGGVSVVTGRCEANEHGLALTGELQEEGLADAVITHDGGRGLADPGMGGYIVIARRMGQTDTVLVLSVRTLEVRAEVRVGCTLYDRLFVHLPPPSPAPPPPSTASTAAAVLVAALAAP